MNENGTPTPRTTLIVALVAVTIWLVADRFIAYSQDVATIIEGEQIELPALDATEVPEDIVWFGMRTSIYEPFLLKWDLDDCEGIIISRDDKKIEFSVDEVWSLLEQWKRDTPAVGSNPSASSQER